MNRKKLVMPTTSEVHTAPRGRQLGKNWRLLRLAGLNLSWRIHLPTALVCLLLIALIFAALIVHVSIGAFSIPPLAVLETLFGNGSRQYTFVVMNLRLPRALIAILVGMALAMSGAILQGLTRNPLATPDVIGINQGASLTAVSLIILVSAAPAGLIPPVAFAGAALAAIIVYALTWRGGSSPTRLLLVGIGLSAIATALIQIMLASAQVLRVSLALIWLAGSVYGRSWEHLIALLPWVGIFMPLALVMARHLNVLNLGDDLARGLGSSVELQRLFLLIICVALAGSAVATAGTIGFVGLMAPHIARRLVGPAYEAILPTAALVGGLLVLLADLLGRVLFMPIEIPAGVITAVVGAPYFVWLLIRSRNL